LRGGDVKTEIENNDYLKIEDQARQQLEEERLAFEASTKVV